MVYGVASMVLPATAPTGTSPPTSHRQTSRAAYCVLRGVHGVRGAWHRGTVAPGTSMQYTVSLFLRRMSPFPPPASLYLVYNFLACQNSCHGRNYLRIFACRSAVTGQRNSALSVVGIATIPIVSLFHP